MFIPSIRPFVMLIPLIRPFVKDSTRPVAGRSAALRRRRFVSFRPSLDVLETRVLLSFNPNQIRHAYGFDRVGFEDSTHALVAGDGTGQTIAIVDAFDDPNIASNLATFDSQYGLPAPPTFTKVNQTGGTTYPPPNTGWAREIALDVEYAHAMAPGADILLVEATNNSPGNLNAAVQYAANHGAVAVSMSYGSPEFAGETSQDSVFTHAGVTYLSATGDGGAPGIYQAFSPNVVAVGGTSLVLSGGNYSSESGWSGSGGGISQYETQPSYQVGVVTQSSNRRTIPDLSFVANPSTGVIVYDTYGGSGFYTVGGTSAATPIMAGLTAIVDQGRSYLFGRTSYYGRDFLNALYALPQSDLHEILTGNNGFPAGPGYNLVTGRGTAIVDRFVSAMIGAPVYNPLTGSLLVTGGGRGGNDTITLGQSGGQLIVQVATDTPVAASGIPANQTFTFDNGQYSSVTVSASDGTTTVNIQGSTPSVPVTLSAQAGTNVLTGPDIDNTWRITGTNAGTLNTTISFSGFQNLTGGSGADTFIFSNGAQVTGTIDGGGGTNTLDYSAYTTGVTVDLSANLATGTGSFLNVQSFAGSAGGGNTLLGPNADTTWNITGSNAGTLSGGFSFTAFQNLLGGSGADTFLFADGAGVAGTIDGGSGTNALNFAAYTGTVIVNLQTGAATGVGGIANIQNVSGGTGAGGYNILVGNGGNVLTGGDNRRNLLIAGASASTLIGGSDENILIAGTTDYDTNLAALMDIMLQWTGPGLYADRVNQVTDPGYTYSLNAGTVHSNGGGNVLIGKPGAATALDLYFAAIGDTTDATAQDTVIGIA
jgi:hypothetical protein